MTNEQLYLVIALPIMSNVIVVLVGILINNSRLSDMQKHLDSRIESLKEVMSAKFDAAHGDLLRVEQVTLA